MIQTALKKRKRDSTWFWLELSFEKYQQIDYYDHHKINKAWNVKRINGTSTSQMSDVEYS